MGYADHRPWRVTVRRAQESRIWAELRKEHIGRALPPDPFVVSEDVELDLTRPCTVVGGRNGSGKSRLLRSIAEQRKDEAVYLDLHHLCEQALMVLREQTSLADMKDELGSLELSDERRADVARIVGRDYEAVDWYAIELGPEDPKAVQRFCWDGDEPLMPYFTATYAGLDYDALEMGLGEFSVHFLFWILEQYRDRSGLLLLLDEPDAYLAPVGVSRLLDRLLAICKARRWRMLISTHSEEMIASAIEHQSFMLLRRSSGGESEGVHSEDDDSIADTLLARPSIRRVLYVEDESAMYLARALLDHADLRLSRTISIVWTKGVGDLVVLRDRLPRPPRPDVRFAVVPDGDQRDEVSDAEVGGRWPLHFLPTEMDPDFLFRTLKAVPADLARALGVEPGALQRKLDDLEGEDDHDWVNQLGEAYGRPHVLTALASHWASLNPEDAKTFAQAVKDAI
ncbi:MULTISPECIES: hypothetical protein [unclassified Microbacterium]|uniref:hypothetical protein n=1 Tax=unclassified Microbacterium TaxID=2609290 RepID=UPI00364DA1AB